MNRQGSSIGSCTSFSLTKLVHQPDKRAGVRSGEQVILDYVTRLIHPSPINHGLVLIDEPELHLHPGWVRQLYRALPQSGSENQYILTTHSAEMRQMAAEDNALIDLGELNGE